MRQASLALYIMIHRTGDGRSQGEGLRTRAYSILRLETCKEEEGIGREQEHPSKSPVIWFPHPSVLFKRMRDDALKLIGKRLGAMIIDKVTVRIERPAYQPDAYLSARLVILGGIW